jgi:glycine cleavage system protein P-like pyridoxal-binding family
VISGAQKSLLHVAKTQLSLNDDTYRDLLQAEAGVRSSNDLDNQGLNRVLKRLGKMGFNNTAHRPLRRQPKGLITPEQQAMIAANYLEMTRLTGGYDTFAKQTGFNHRCCHKSIPQTRADGINVIEGQKAIIERNS